MDFPGIGLSKRHHITLERELFIYNHGLLIYSILFINIHISVFFKKEARKNLNNTIKDLGIFLFIIYFRTLPFFFPTIPQIWSCKAITYAFFFCQILDYNNRTLVNFATWRRCSASTKDKQWFLNHFQSFWSISLIQYVNLNQMGPNQARSIVVHKSKSNQMKCNLEILLKSFIDPNKLDLFFKFKLNWCNLHIQST